MTGRRLLHILVINALLFIAAGAYAQDFPVLHYIMADGLPSNKVYSIYRDSKGYMWIATDKGVARYNGVRFEIFTTFNGLPDNEVFFFQEDLCGRLWLATYNGELCYYKDDTFHTAANTPFLNVAFKFPFIKRIALEKDSSLTFVFAKSRKFINIKNEQVKVISSDTLKFNATNGQVIEREKMEENRYRLTYPDEILEIDTAGIILARSKLSIPDIAKEQPGLWGVYFTQNQSYIMSEHHVLTRQGEVIKNFNDTFRKKNILYIVYHNSLSFFFGTNNGILINERLRILQGYQVSCITQDRQGDYWVSTLENGVFVLDKDFMNTKIYKDAYKGKIRYANALKDHLYFTTTDNKLYELAAGKVNTLFNYNSYISEEAKLSNSWFFLIDSNYRYFYFDNKEAISIDNLLASALRIRRHKCDPVNSNDLKGAIETGNDLYINAGNKVLKLDLTKMKTGETLKFDLVCNDVGNEKIYGFEKAPDNNIWYSTVSNVSRIENDVCTPQPEFKNRSFKYFYFSGDNLIGYTHYNKFLECKNYNGAIRINSESGQNCIWDMFYKLDAGHVLISTNNFYRLLNLSTLKISIIENPFIPLQADAICSDGLNVYFFKNGTITSIELQRFLKPTDPPRLFFTYLRAGRKQYRIQSEMQLPYEESKNINIAFSTLSSSGKDVSYLYSVSKDEDNWQPVTGEEINLVNAGFGYNTIKVKAKTVATGYSAPIVFTLYIARPFWYTWWFITLSVWAVLALLVGIVRYRLLLVMRKRERLHETEIKFMRSEYKAMNALMNPHFIFNTLNNVQSLVNANDKVAANNYLRIFADLVRQNMHNISKELIPLQKEIDLVANYLSLEKLRFEDKLNYAFDIDEQVDLSEIMVAPLLIQPLVENSIKHGILPMRKGKGVIKIVIYESNNALYIEVKDNGVGMGQNKDKGNPLHESYGLENIKKRIEQLSIIQNKKIEFYISEVNDWTNHDNWTVVTIMIPITE